MNTNDFHTNVGDICTCLCHRPWWGVIPRQECNCPCRYNNIQSTKIQTYTFSEPDKNEYELLQASITKLEDRIKELEKSNADLKSKLDLLVEVIRI